MGLFDRIFRPDKAKESEKALHQAKELFTTLTAYKPSFSTWGGAIYESELVRAAIDARARHISKLKIEVHGSAQPSLQTKLRAGPNQWQTWSQFMYRTSTILDVTNNAIIVPVFDADMVITGYFPVLPSRCDLVDYKGEPWIRFKFSHGEVGAVEMKKCAVLTKYQYKDDFFGSTNHALDETMKLAHIQNQGIEEAVKNSATYRFMAQMNNFSTAEDLALERQRFSMKNFSQDAEAGGLLLFPNTYSNIKQLENSTYSVDSEQMKVIQGNVYRYFGVNEKVMTNAANGDELDAFYNGAVEPFSIQFSEAMTKAIFSERERASGSRMIATADRLQYMTTAAKVSMAQQLLDRGVMTVNEARSLFNYPEVDGGDIRFIRGEYKNTDEAEVISNADEG